MATIAPSYNISVEELDANSPRAEQPSRAHVQLKPHQLAMLCKCIAFEEEEVPVPAHLANADTGSSEGMLQNYMMTRIGIMGDMAGSGKSYVILSLILDNDRLKRSPLMHACGLNKVFICYTDHLRQVNTNMLVVPYNLVAQWEVYLRVFAPSLRYTVINRSKSMDTFYNVDFSATDLILVSSSFYNRVAMHIDTKKIRLYRVFFDEVDNMNIPGCEKIEARFYWFVTASYGNLLYPKGYSHFDAGKSNVRVFKARGIRDSGFIRNLFTDLAPSKLVARLLVVKNQDSFVSDSMAMSQPESLVVRCRTPFTLSVLSGVVENNIIESLNAADVQTAMQLINPMCRGTEDNIIENIIERYMRNVRNTDVNIGYCRAYEYANEQERAANIQRLENRKQDYLRKIESIKERIRTTEMCTICYEPFVTKSVVPCCSNSFCFRCIQLWLSRNRSCPLCKVHVTRSEVMVVDPDAVIENHDTEVHETNDKATNLRVILSNLADDARVLIFSAYDNTFMHVTPVLEELGMRYEFLKGNTSKTNKVVQDYRTTSLRILLVNARNFGCGLNLENTTDIIMFHKFDNEIEKQVIGRANRFGQNGRLKVWYLLHDNEVMTN